MYRRLTVLLAVAVFAVACDQEVVETTSTTSPTTTTTTTTVPTTTTTTIPPFAIENAPPELVAVVEDFYDYATGAGTERPPAPEPVLASITPADVETPRSGVSSVSTFKGQGVAVALVGPDVFLAVGDGPEWRIVGGRWPSLSLPDYFGPHPRLVALVGSDARPGEDVAASRADSIHFVGLDGQGHGGVVGVPRDSYVPIGGGGRSKINAALSFGGPEVMMETFRDLTGLPLEGYVLTGFAGFEEMVSDVLGGFVLDIPFAINDRAAKADLEAGEQHLDGRNALAFSRVRKTLPGGDFTRSEHQGLLLIGAARGIQMLGFGSIPRLMKRSEPSMLTDLSPEQLLTFAAMTIASDLDAVPNVVAPGHAGRAGRASVVYLSDDAAAVWADLADGRLGS